MDDPTPHESTRRRFGFRAGYLVVVGSMIGAGILTTSGYTLRDTGNPAALLGLWAVGGVLALCGAVTIAELATALPRSGGDYIFAREAFGHGAGFVSGWATFSLGFAAPTALIAILSLKYLLSPFTEYLNDSLPGWAATSAAPLGATLLILTVGIGHSLGHRHSSWLQLVATVVTAIVLLGLSIGGIAIGKGNWQHFSASSWPPVGQLPLIAIGLIYVGYSYAGWNGAAYIAGEIRDPSRLLPRCMIAGVITVVIVYLLVNVAYCFALDPVEMTNRSKDDVEQVAELAARKLFGDEVGWIISIALGLSLLASVSAYLLTGPRVAYAMARDGAFPGFAGRLHTSRKTPIAATLSQVVFSIALVWSGSFLELLDYTAVGLAMISGLTVASVFPLRRRVGFTNSYKLPFYPIPPLAYLALTIWTVAATLDDPERRGPAILSLATLLVGIPLSGFLRRKHVAEDGQ